jgi:hypothetical protein
VRRNPVRERRWPCDGHVVRARSSDYSQNLWAESTICAWPTMEVPPSLARLG